MQVHEQAINEYEAIQARYSRVRTIVMDYVHKNPSLVTYHTSPGPENASQLL